MIVPQGWHVTACRNGTGMARATPLMTAIDHAISRRTVKYLAVYLVLAVASFIAGLQHFVLTLPHAPQGKLHFTDGIVVMTGGQQRLDDGLRLLTAQKRGKMLISGVGEGVNRAVLVQELGLDDHKAELLFCCVELDFEAGNTRGNAIAARAWALRHSMYSLRLVTASYHMPRALLVFAREMPEFDLYQWPVTPVDLNIAGWWRDRAMIRLLAREYAKYLAETIRI
jgi:uncharacterized SAM-binding protein YcdF (DUF218 family)